MVRNLLRRSVSGARVGVMAAVLDVGGSALHAWGSYRYSLELRTAT